MSYFSHSQSELHQQCPYRYELSYIKKLDTLPEYNPSSPLDCGQLVHRSCETDFKTAVHEYFMSYPIINDIHINEAFKVELLQDKIHKAIKSFEGEKEHEVLIETPDFKGYLDLVIHNEDGTVDIVDFKYSNNIKNYMNSGQLHEYKYFYELTQPKKVRKLWFMFIPKTQIRQKKTEDLYAFRRRIRTTLEPMEVTIKEVIYDPNKVVEFTMRIKHILEAKEFPKNETYLCKWCNFQPACQESKNYLLIKKLKRGRDEMNLPSIERRDLNKEVKRRKFWIYGAPTSGKTTFLDGSPNPLNLNTDGNIKEVTMPVLPIKDIIKVEGRQTKKTFAWQVFKDTISELEKNQNEFKTVIIDLVEDVREMCRLYNYDKMGIEHETDAGYGKGWDIIKTDFLSTMRRFFNLEYENLAIVSHEDTSKDITKKTGDKITRIAPNIKEQLANKLAGMVDLVGRIVIEDDGSRTLNFKQNEVVFGGTRLHNLKAKSIPLDWDKFIDVYDNREEKAEPVEKKIELDKKEKELAKDINEGKAEITGVAAEPEVEEKPKTKKTRKTKGKSIDEIIKTEDLIESTDPAVNVLVIDEEVETTQKNEKTLAEKVEEFKGEVKGAEVGEQNIEDAKPEKIRRTRKPRTK